MSLTKQSIEDRMTDFVESCRRRGVRVTHQRLEIYREVASLETHPDADTVFRRVRKRIPTIALDTVYRNLKSLAELGLVSIVGTSPERLRFDANVRRHHHFVCVRCGSIQDFCSESLGGVEPPPEANALGEPVSMHLEVKGVCKNCGTRTKRRR
ncbi:transcriptional repressor [Candidatus Sumerlaeota bacterium]|nr:transcriptional repressor [Candidatus Sumerlaeota bacterium]